MNRQHFHSDAQPHKTAAGMDPHLDHSAGAAEFFCPYCGKPIAGLNQYCGACGRYIADPAVPAGHISTSIPQPQQPAASTATVLQPHSGTAPVERRLNWLWVAGLIMGVILLAIGAFRLVQLREPVMDAAPSPETAFLPTIPAAFPELEQEPTRKLEAPADADRSTFTPEPPTATAVPTDPPPMETAVPSDTPPAESGAGTTRVREADGMVQVFVPAGDFLFGSDDGDSDERPLRSAYVNSFWIDQTEVTTAQYQRCVADGSCTLPQGLESGTRSSYYLDERFMDYPVILVNFYQASQYCDWAGSRLPHEDEWEKAARGTDGRTYPWGNVAPDRDHMNFDHYVGDTMPVASYPEGASPYGVMDMSGNVWEWIDDLYDPNYYMHRGGSWDFGPRAARSANRGGDSPNSAYFNLGFRCVSSD